MIAKGENKLLRQTRNQLYMGVKIISSKKSLSKSMIGENKPVNNIQEIGYKDNRLNFPNYGGESYSIKQTHWLM